MTIRNLMNGHTSAEIICLFRQVVVRRLTCVDDDVIVDALTDKVTVPLDTQLVYEPWFIDRGSILFNGDMKLCTEGDLIRFPDGSEQSVGPG